MSIKQDYIDRINKNIANANALNADDFIEEAKKKNAAKKQKDIDAINSRYDVQLDNVKSIYNNEIESANVAYTNEYERNAVQKLINEKKIAERNANLGITDSGINRTQQTAVQLGYARQKGDIDLARQKTLDELGISLTNAVTTLQNEKSDSARNIENQWDNLSYEQGINTYNSKLGYYNDQIAADNDALTKIYEAESNTVRTPPVSYGSGGTLQGKHIIETSGGLLSRDYMGSLTDNNIDVIYNTNGTTTYVDNNSGKKTTLDSVINPYTGTKNKDVDNGAFKNGYQPNNINGKLLVIEDRSAIEINNQLQNVFKCGKKYYAWDGKANEYFEVIKINDGSGKYHWGEK